MKASLTRPASSQLGGSSVSLEEVVRTSNSRAGQSASIAVYWDLCSAVADYYLSLHEQGELERLSRTSHSGTPVRESLAKLKTRRDTALTAARATQLRLASLMYRSETGVMPLPGDLPLCGVYETRYSQSFPGGGPREAVELNRLLPLRHAELLGAATAVADAEDWYNTVASRQTNDQGAGAAKALELLALNRRAFVQITRDYNKRISRYTELARPGNLRTERLVSMLIKTDRNLASRRSRPSTPPPGRRSDSPPPTFRDDWRDPARSVAPRMDAEVLPTAGFEEGRQAERGGEELNMVERVEPGETSVLRKNQQD